MVRFSGYHDFIYDDHMNEEWLTGVGTWAGKLQRWVGNGMVGFPAVSTLVDWSFVRCIEECRYESRLGRVLDALCAADVVASKLSLCSICYDRPFMTWFWISNFKSWSKKPHYKVFMRTSRRLPVFAGWQIVELYAISPRWRL